MKIPWYYMWSPKYEIFHRLFIDTMKEESIEVYPIFIEQSTFDAELDDKKAHQWMGCDRKVRLVLDALRTTKESYILFTDIDIIIKGTVYDKLQEYIANKTTMVFLKEGQHCNIGVCFLKVCPEVISFWETILHHMQREEAHDQGLVNKYLSSYTNSWTTFPTKQFACSNTWDGSEFTLFQPLCSRLSPELDFAEKIFYIAQFTNIQNYMKYLTPAIIDNIYKFQDILCSRKKNAS